MTARRAPIRRHQNSNSRRTSPGCDEKPTRSSPKAKENDQRLTNWPSGSSSDECPPEAVASSGRTPSHSSWTATCLNLSTLHDSTISRQRFQDLHPRTLGDLHHHRGLRHRTYRGLWRPWSTPGNKDLRPVEPNRRLTDRIIPARLAMADATPANQRMLFSPAAHTDLRARRKTARPARIRKTQTRHPLHCPSRYTTWEPDRPAVAGKGAPLALRIFVESVLSVPMQDRERGQPVAMSVSLREFLQVALPKPHPEPRRILAQAHERQSTPWTASNATNTPL